MDDDADVCIVCFAPQLPVAPRVSEPPAQPECAVEDCSNPSYTRGWCSRHYSRWQTTGDPLTPYKRAQRGELLPTRPPTPRVPGALALLGIEELRPLMAQALAAYAVDVALGEAMCGTANVILTKRAAWRSRTLLRSLSCQGSGMPELRGDWKLQGLDEWLLSLPLPPVPLTPVCTTLPRSDESCSEVSDDFEHEAVWSLHAPEPFRDRAVAG